MTMTMTVIKVVVLEVELELDVSRMVILGFCIFEKVKRMIT